MTSESLARRFRPAGFDQPEGSRRNYVKPRVELQETFGDWLKEIHEYNIDYYRAMSIYYRAREMVQKIPAIKETHPAEIQSVLIPFEKDERIKYAGLFLTACYNLCPDQNILWDLDIDQDIDYIGFKLAEVKRLVLNADCADDIGAWSEGVVINLKTVKGWMAHGAKAPSVNLGIVEGYMACNAEAPSINMGIIGNGMAWYAQNIQANIAVVNPKGKFHKHGEICLDEQEAKQHTNLIKYFEDFKTEMETYRTAGFQECLGVFGVIDRYIGKSTQEFMKKLRSLL